MCQDSEVQQEEHERLVQRHNKLLRDAEERDHTFRKRSAHHTQETLQEFLTNLKIHEVYDEVFFVCCSVQP